MSREPVPDPQQLTTLVALVKLKAGTSNAVISTSRLGEALGLSQQAASRRLADLEQSGLVERSHSGRGLSVRLTDEGLEAVQAVYAYLKGALEGEGKDVVFRGYVFTGFGEGGYYISVRGYTKQFREALGFEPFPGTLNLRLSQQSMVDRRRLLRTMPGVEIRGFKDGRRSYGPVKCFRAKIEGKFQGAVLAIERTHYDNSVLEVICHLNLRKTLALKDGDECSVVAYPENPSSPR